MWGTLTVIDTDAWVYVAVQDDPEDWVARFEKVHAFPAQEWAERMVMLHNSALRERGLQRTLQPPVGHNAPFNPRAR